METLGIIFIWVLGIMAIFRVDKTAFHYEINHKIIDNFLVYCDGMYDIQLEQVIPNTTHMGVCHLCFDEGENILHVHLQKPSVLIGKAGSIIERLEEHLDCKIQIHEVVLGRKTKLNF